MASDLSMAIKGSAQDLVGVRRNQIQRRNSNPVATGLYPTLKEARHASKSTPPPPQLSMIHRGHCAPGRLTTTVTVPRGSPWTARLWLFCAREWWGRRPLPRAARGHVRGPSPRIRAGRSLRSRSSHSRRAMPCLYAGSRARLHRIQ